MINFMFIERRTGREMRTNGAENCLSRAVLFIGPQIVKTLRLDWTQVAAIRPGRRDRNNALQHPTRNRAHLVERRTCHHARPHLKC